MTRVKPYFFFRRYRRKTVWGTKYNCAAITYFFTFFSQIIKDFFRFCDVSSAGFGKEWRRIVNAYNGFVINFQISAVFKVILNPIRYNIVFKIILAYASLVFPHYCEIQHIWIFTVKISVLQSIRACGNFYLVTAPAARCKPTVHLKRYAMFCHILYFIICGSCIPVVVKSDIRYIFFVRRYVIPAKMLALAP